MATRGKVKDILDILKRDGWVFAGQRGSHRQFSHPVKPGRVTVPGKLSDDVHIGTWDSIMRQAGLK